MTRNQIIGTIVAVAAILGLIYIYRRNRNNARYQSSGTWGVTQDNTNSARTTPIVRDPIIPVSTPTYPSDEARSRTYNRSGRVFNKSGQIIAASRTLQEFADECISKHCRFTDTSTLGADGTYNASGKCECMNSSDDTFYRMSTPVNPVLVRPVLRPTPEPTPGRPAPTPAPTPNPGGGRGGDFTP